ncbi:MULTISPECIES: thymidylate synthase [unclassified Microcoleus]|uniref:thymidylate synthase n=1 Tax=unclassified Microcoleus TaxID=2642155 RepID=UPI001DFC06A5|nr:MULTISPECIES: thymidylate synthase [unclassified Microcoleus]MCC3411550.1 thymidylate synthase [Microcoleus sp. PH2017_02_FOX_O_A]MCC3422827.1 thymidylate synthase [Microcoleus sp. PH2017_01_SCD_O_A]
MSNSLPLIIEETNLSHAWSRAFLHIIDNPGKEVSPLLITLTGFTNSMPKEDQAIRDALDNCLKINNEQSVHTVANTIFPASYWQRSNHNRNKLFDTYLENFPRIQALSPKKNKRGLYFERLIAYGSGPNNGNQLEYIISQYKSRTGVRRSMFQASIFDPARDHIIDPRIPFPCLQHVSFIPQKNKSLIMNAFYATQLLFNKAYGNYLGLCKLGNFMAHEMGLTFERMNCFVGVAKMDNIPKKCPTLEELKKVARQAV